MTLLAGSEMPNTNAKLLIVDDEQSIRTSLSLVLGEIGYCVRTAGDGLSALAELRNDVPDILLSDLNMPAMSGFELLAVVRRRFPSVQTVAMSGAFFGDEVPSGVAADGFFQKGSSVAGLLKVIDGLPRPDRMADNHATATEPMWVQKSGQSNPNEASVTIACPECLRSFAHTYGDSDCDVRTAHCTHCNGLIHFFLVDPVLEKANQSRETLKNASERTVPPSSMPPYFH
jgi:CheY-like chemotaxis protein